METINVRPPVYLLLTAVVLGGLFYLGGKHLETRDREIPVITVSGEGKTSAAPDIAEITLGFQVSRQRNAGDAMNQLTRGTDAVLAAIKAQGIEDKDIRTENFSLNPVYDWTSGRQTILGYEASQSMRVKVRDLDKVSPLLGAATSAGANQAGNVQFTIDDPEAARSAARAEAIAQAQEKAERLADDLGMRLGRIRSFDENYGGGPTPPVYMRGIGTAESDAAQNAVPLPAGEQDVAVQVSITYELR